ncbi:MAG: PIN domain-containing protein [Chloroflexota bacterium]|nr:PIN domain-containing protein [Chloroflexota bacterium]
MGEIERECRELLGHYSILGLDTMTFIYHFEENKEYLPFTRALFELIEDGRIEGKTSVITRLEILVKPRECGNEILVDEYKLTLENFPHLEVIPVDATVADLASDIRAKYKLRTPDAIQLAASISRNAQAFVTNDESLKKVKGIEIVVMREVLGRLRK